MSFSEDIQELVWVKGRVVDGYDSHLFRQDACGAWMRRDLYGVEDLYGWEIDHILPRLLGGGDELENLRPMQHQNNVSKGGDYPSYLAVVSSDGAKNVSCKKQCIVNKKIQGILSELYKQ